MKKPTADKNSKTKTDAVGKTSRPKNSSDFSKTYIELRTMLDALEVTALRYCLWEEDESVRTKRAEEMTKSLKPIVQKYQAELRMGGGDTGVCNDGFFCCNGVCVPFPCP
ncbi:MAG: hypothetical protein ABI686_08525 [Acidobacteriota bacterium]